MNFIIENINFLIIQWHLQTELLKKPKIILNIHSMKKHKNL